MTTTFRSVTVRKLAGKIKAARTHAELLDLAEASHGVMTDQQFADALADREHALESERRRGQTREGVKQR